MPVATFVSVKETSKAIQEALQMIYDKNDEWQPHYFMVDYSVAEMNAILAVFPGEHQ
jgi:hypothetical protein